MNDEYRRSRGYSRGDYPAPERQRSGKKGKFLRSPRRMVREALKYTALYFVFLYWWEFVLNIAVYGNPFGRSLWTVLFLIPIAFFLSAVTGLFRRAVNNRRGCLIITIALSIFYDAELIYYNSFGSLFSFSMVGMGGDAVVNFWFCVVTTVFKSLPLLILLQLPWVFVLFGTRLPAVHHFLRFRGYRGRFHLVPVVAAFLCWGFVVLLLPITGKSAGTTYSAYHSSTTDTDTGSEKLGALANMIVEIKVSKFGGGSSSSEDVVSGAGALTSGTSTNGTTTDGTTTDGTTTDGTAADGTAADGTTTDGTAADGTSTDGTSTDGTTTDGTAAVGTTTASSGKNAFASLDFTQLASVATSDDIKSVCEYLATQEPTSKNEMTGKFAGYNLIYICAESFSVYAIDETVTPTLYKMANSGIVLDNFYNGFKNTTTNGEYAFVSGLWPDVSRESREGTAVGSMPQSATHNMMPSFGNMMNSAGYKTRGFHDYKGSYYSRNESWPNMGIYGKFKGSGLTMTKGWPASDLEMMQLSVGDYINEDPFCAYYMTVSGHGVYTDSSQIVKKNKSTVKKLLKAAGKKMSSDQIGYLAANYELDQAMQYLLEQLEAAGKLDKTLIVLIGDHYPYYLKKSARDAFAGHEVGSDIERYKSTCIMYNSAMETTHVSTPCCNVDILPTVLNLFGVTYDSRLYAGTDIFGDGTHVAQLFNLSYITEDVQFIHRNSKSIWSETADSWTDEEKQAYVDKYSDVVNNRYNFSLAVENTDFYKFVWDNCPNLPQQVDVTTFALATDDTSGTEETDDSDDDANMDEGEGDEG